MSFRLFKPVSRFDLHRGFDNGISPFSKPQTTAAEHTHENTPPEEAVMTMTFAPARKQAAHLKLAITGPSGSGKTTGALRVARGLVGPEGKIGLIDTEHHSASLYADKHQFDALNLDPPYDPPTFAAAIKAGQEAGFDCLIVDTLSHAWEAVLEFKEALDRRGGNSYTNWNAAGEKWKEVLRALLNSPQHVIVCIRSKMEYAMEKTSEGKTTVRKVGLAPISRDGTEYEFTLVWDLDISHSAMASKDRTRLFDGKATQLTEAEGKTLAAWLTTTDPTAIAPAPVPPPSPPTPPPPLPAPPPKPSKAAAVDATLPAWFEAHEAAVNDYLVRVKWIAEGQTHRDLTTERLLTVARRKSKFALAAGIPMPEEVLHA